MSSVTYVGRLFQVMSRMTDVRRATYYVNEKYTVKLTRQRKHSKKDVSETFIMSCGRPNYRERAFIKACVKAEDKFPVKKIQLQYWPKQRKK